jgi:hypothetical protein
MNPYLMKRMLGHSVVDEHGQLKDAVGTAFELRDYMVKTYGKERATANLSMMGMSYESAAALINANKAEAVAAGNAKPSKANEEALKRYLGTDAGKRDTADAQLAVSSRALLGSSTALGRAADALQRFAASHPVASTFASTAAAGLTGAAAAAVGKTVTLGVRAGIAAVVGGGAKAGLALGGATLAGGAVLIGAGAAGAYGIHKFDLAEQERERLQAHARDVAADSNLQNRLIAIRRTNAASHTLEGLTPAQESAARNAATKIVTGKSDALAALQFSHGGGGAFKELADAIKGQKGGFDDATIDKMTRSFITALQGANGIKVEIANAADTPITANVKNTHSAAAGHQ